MAYCTVTDVARLTQMAFARGSGNPTEEELTAIIEDVAAELNGAASAAGYTIPVTGTQAVALMKRYNTLGAAVDAWHARFVSDAEPPRVEHWRTSYQTFIDRLTDSKVALPDETPTGEGDPAFDIAPTIRRDTYFTTGQEVT